MPVPTLLTDLSTTPASNYPAGSESPAVIDDHIRAHAALMATLRDQKQDASAISAFGLTLVDDADAAAARATLVVPSRTGADASGTWGVSITGNAATATDCSRSVSAAGLATGGGALTADRTITVTAASQVQAEAGSDNATAMTPLRTLQAIAANLPSSAATNGWQEFPGGVIVQWGTVLSGPGSNTVAISFPIAFPSAIATVLVANGDTVANVGETGVRLFSTTGATFQNLRDTNAMRHNWIAVGY